MVDFVKTCCRVNTRIAWQDFFISKLRFIISWLWYVRGKLHQWSTPRRTTAKLYAFKTSNQLRLFQKKKNNQKILKRFPIEMCEWRETLSNTNVMVEEYLVYRNFPSLIFNIYSFVKWMANRNIFICLQKGSSSWVFNEACLKYFDVNNRLKGNSPRDWDQGLYPTRIRKSPSYLKCTFAWLGDRNLYLSSDLLLFLTHKPTF